MKPSYATYGGFLFSGRGNWASFAAQSVFAVGWAGLSVALGLVLGRGVICAFATLTQEGTIGSQPAAWSRHWRRGRLFFFVIDNLSMNHLNNTPVADRVAQAETRIFKAVFPSTTNHYDTLFGGTALQLMDEVAFITATRFARKRMVTVSSDKINFTKSIPAGTIIELIGRVEHVGNTSVRVAVEIFVEEMYSMERHPAIHGTFTFVALDENKRPIPVL